MDTLNFYDCNCSIGMRGVLNPGSFYTVEELERKMKHYGIGKALVYHSMAKEYNPGVGNKLLLEEIKDHPALTPVWVVMHHHTQEFPEPGELIRDMRKYGIKAVRMFPGQWEQNFSIADWNCKELFTVLQEYRIPVMIGLDSIGWNDFYDLLNNYPELNVIITEADYRIDRNLYSMLRKFDNLYIEIMGYKAHSGIEEICKKFGAHRLIFGSGMPVFSGAAVVCMVNYARISEEEKKLIAGGNLEKLLGGVRI